jgi:hypothetical protein
MGMLARILRFVWRRWADYNSFVAILDLFDWKTGFFSLFGFVAMIIFGATNADWSIQGIFLAALIAAACVSIIVVAFRIFFIGRPIIIGDQANFRGMVGDQSLIESSSIKENMGARLRAEQTLDLTAWDRVPVFTIRQAAQLWSGERPTPNGQLSQFAEVVQRELIEAGNQNKITIEAPPPMSDFHRLLLQLAVLATGRALGKTFVNSEVTRENLRAYALSTNERPLFLFPENR